MAECECYRVGVVKCECCGVGVADLVIYTYVLSVL